MYLLLYNLHALVTLDAAPRERRAAVRIGEIHRRPVCQERRQAPLVPVRRGQGQGGAAVRAAARVDRGALRHQEAHQA